MPAKSEKQRRFMGIVHGMQTGAVPKSYSKKAAKVADEISPDDAKDFAKNENEECDDDMSLREIFKRLEEKYRSKLRPRS